MRYVEEFLELEKIDDCKEIATRPKLAAMALMELSLLKGDEPVSFKKRKPIFEHAINSRNRKLARLGHEFPIRVRQQSAVELPCDVLLYARYVASMSVQTQLGQDVYEFSEAQTSISGNNNSSTRTVEGITVVANAWRQVDDSVRNYLRLQHDNILEYGIPTT